MKVAEKIAEARMKITKKTITVVLLDAVSIALGIAMYREYILVPEILQGGVIFFALPMYLSIWRMLAESDANETPGIRQLLGEWACFLNSLVRWVCIIWGLVWFIKTGVLGAHIVLAAFYFISLAAAAFVSIFWNW